MNDNNVFVDSIDLRAADVNIVAGQIDGQSIGDLVRRTHMLTQVGVFGHSCIRCGEPHVTRVRGKISWEPLCRTHGYAGEWISDDTRHAMITDLVASGAPPHVIAAYFNFAIKRAK